MACKYYFSEMYSVDRTRAALRCRVLFSSHFQYSTVLKKLYIDINKVVCVQFKLKQPVSGKINSSKESLAVRALPVYAAPEFLQEPVSRCPVHVMTDKANGKKNQFFDYGY